MSSDKKEGYVTGTNIVLGVSLVASVGGGLYLYNNLKTTREQLELLKKENEALATKLKESQEAITKLSFNIQGYTNTMNNRIESLERSFSLSIERSERPVPRPKRITIPKPKPVVQEYEDDDEEDEDEEAMLAQLRAEEASLLRK